MPDYAITIARDQGGKVTFDPSPCNVRPGDNITWRNKDHEAHWPGRLNADGKVEQQSFMKYQIPPNGTSTAFSPSTPGSVEYGCSLHPPGKVGAEKASIFVKGQSKSDT